MRPSFVRRKIMMQLLSHVEQKLIVHSINQNLQETIGPDSGVMVTNFAHMLKTIQIFQ